MIPPEEMLAQYLRNGGTPPPGIPLATIQAMMGQIGVPTGMLGNIASQQYRPQGYGYAYGDGIDGMAQVHSNAGMFRPRGSTTAERVANAEQQRQQRIAQQRAESAARQQRIQQGMDPANARWTPHTYYGGGSRAPRAIGSGSRVLENADIDFAGINAYQNASPQQQAYLAAQGLAPNISQGQWSSGTRQGVGYRGPTGPMPGVQGGPVNMSTFGQSMGPPQPQAGPNTNMLQQILAQLGGPVGGGGAGRPLGGGGVGRGNISLVGRQPGFAGQSSGLQDELRRNSLIKRGNEAAAAQASQVRQRALAGGESAGMAERRVMENRAITEQGRRDSIAQNDLAYRADARADQQLGLQRLGITADLAGQLAQAFASGGYLF